MAASSEMSDATITDFMRRHRAVSVAELVRFTGITATAVRQRLLRLMKQGWIEREALKAGRGRPTHRYSLTREGLRSCGSNCEDLAKVLWSEVRAIEDEGVRHGLLQRVAARLLEMYRDKVDGATLRERMNALVTLMEERNVPFEVRARPTTTNPLRELLVLTALACPYPDLAEQDRMVCALEKMLFSEMLNARLRMIECRLDGGNCCSFEVIAAAKV